MTNNYRNYAISINKIIAHTLVVNNTLPHKCKPHFPSEIG